MNFCKFVVDIKSVYMMSSEFGLSSGKSMFKILIAGEGGGRGRGEIRGGVSISR